MHTADRLSRSDADIVRQVIAGNVESFAILFRRHRDAYTRFAVRMLGDRGDAEDVLQGAWMRAFRNLKACRDPGRFSSWMFQIVANECRTFAGRRGSRDRRFADGDNVLDRIAAPERSDNSALRDEIQRAIDRLPDDQREAFVLKHVEELSYDEMIDITGVGESALKMRVKRACERLRELLEGVHNA
jgi:RNA polymerase sigma-70 factor, ECF subfamily